MTDLPESFNEGVVKKIQKQVLEQLIEAYKEGAKGNSIVLTTLEKHLKQKNTEEGQRNAALSLTTEANRALRNVFNKLCYAYFTSVEISHGSYSYSNGNGFYSLNVDSDDTDLKKLLGINYFRPTSTERAPTEETFDVTLKDGFLNKALGLEVIQLEGEIPNDSGDEDVSCRWNGESKRCYVSFAGRANSLTAEHVETLNYINNHISVFEFVSNYDLDDEIENRYEAIRRAVIEKALLDVFEGKSTREDLDKKMLFIKLSNYGNLDSLLT